ncbi:tripartite tricarboxylate transporter TctB family protein [Roseivivax sediminis]|uniref:Tripartite tricarboxylate transporter TctB family protein n=1 Tax=Roseivivax sediminis TaxID=936889 RepID=A0A1I1WAR1_9RHOB|nr:tripartite tricarboxylate transporter TctB family protein [Roseivivax sediminis]SFD92276.1 Tripartite tricarboxylate transporter TctB family protein [Roseivivax sediminis]
MRASELVLLVTIAGFSAVLCVQSLEFRYTSAQGFGPGFVPMNFAIATLVLGLLIMLKSRKATSDATAPSAIGERFRAALPAVAAAALLFAATYVMHLGSVLLPLFAVMVVISLTMLGHSLIRALLLNAITLAAVFAIFNLWLNIPVT